VKALFVASGRDEAEGVLFRVVLGAESVATTLASVRSKIWRRLEVTQGPVALSRTFDCDRLNATCR
jgi:hypothetical protein